MTPLTAEQYSELVIALEAMRAACPLDGQWLYRLISPFAYVYLTQWFHRIGVNPDTSPRDVLLWVCTHMVAELCEERCAEPEYQNDVQAAFGGIVQTPQG